MAQVAAKNDIPFVILRTMSDNCDEDAREKLVVQQFDITDYVTELAGEGALTQPVFYQTERQGRDRGENRD